MFLFNNPVLQRELLVNLRMGRAFVLLLVYQALLGAVVYFAWPRSEAAFDLTPGGRNAMQTRALVNLFFSGQFVIASLMAPSFAAGTITGEKERATYEMLLASPLEPASIVLGKLLAALAHLAILIFASLPIVMLCIPLGGVSLYEVLAAYGALVVAVAMFGMISVACSAYFQRTSASLVVSYLAILPVAMVGAGLWEWFSAQGAMRLAVFTYVIPPMAYSVCVLLFFNTAARLLHPPDVGAEGKDVVDLEREAEQVVGLVIRRDQFPDYLFAPEKRNDLMEDGSNPVYDKEMRSEIFSQGTLMLRIVIQMSMFLTIPLMAWFLYITPERCPFFIAYVVLFNMLVGPVFSAGSVTSERERETLDLLLTTTITPWQILWGKLISGLRVSTVLTLFLLWPLLLACAMVPAYWNNLPAVFAYLSVVGFTCLTTAMTALFCSALFKKTATSLMTTYVIIIALFAAPVAVGYFADKFFPTDPATPVVKAAGFTSPFISIFSVPLDINVGRNINQGIPNTWHMYAAYVSFTLLYLGGLMTTMIWLFNSRWRVSTSGG